MKVIHGSLAGLLQEVRDKKIDTVRVAAFMQTDVVTEGIPRYTAWVVVTALIDWDVWAEWRLLVGRGYAEATEQGAALPSRIAEVMAMRTAEIRARVSEAGFGVRDGMLAHDAEAIGGALDPRGT